MTHLPKFDYVLADTPFLAVGVLGFCTFTFLALVKRLGMYVLRSIMTGLMLTVCGSALTILHLSIIAAFTASTLDLAQILQRGIRNTELGLQLDTVQPLIKTREIAYALSTSLRFLFFWIFVAEPPKAERDTSAARAGVHCGNWNAWGFLGRILQYSTLGLTLAVFALQVIWRIDSKFDGFTTVYAADSAIQIILSAVFVLKLLLNSAHLAIASKRTCLVDYMGFIASLCFGIGFGIANLMSREYPFRFVLDIHGNISSLVKFTEGIVGRFLGGVNFYLIVLCSLLTVFTSLPKPQSDRTPSFRPVSQKRPTSSFNFPPPDVSTSNLSGVQLQPDQPMVQPPWVARPSSTAKLSGWLATQRKRLSNLGTRGVGQDDMNAQLWNQTWAERGQPLQDDASTKDSDVFEKIYGSANSYLGTDPTPAEAAKLEAPRLGRSHSQSTKSLYSGLDLSPLGMGDRKLRQVDSPVFGLNGIVRSPNQRSEMGLSPVTDPGRASGFSSLLRKKEELDNSIAALKMFGGPSMTPPSPPLSSPPPLSPPPPSPPPPSPPSPLTPPSSQPSRELSARSEFSLSNFPSPPWVDAPDLGDHDESLRPISSLTARPPLLNPSSISVDNVPFDLVRPRVPLSTIDHARALSLPISEYSASEVLVSARTQRFDSEGTQYDVTSFIGSRFF